MIRSVAIYGLIGSVVFTALILLQLALGKEHQARTEDGEFKRQFSPPGLALLILSIVVFVGAPVLGILHYEQEVALGNEVAFLQAFAIGGLIVLFINLWDLVVIDILLLLVIAPRFVKNIPQTEYYTKVKPHVVGFFKGLIYVAVFGAVAALITRIL